MQVLEPRRSRYLDYRYNGQILENLDMLISTVKNKLFKQGL